MTPTSLDPSALLAQLKDVHAPPTPGLWPPAIGWWLLTLLVVGVTVFSVMALVRWRRRTAWRRLALREFEQLQRSYLQSASLKTLTDISGLLKRCAASALNQPTLLSATGEQWAKYLAEPAELLQPDEIELLADGHYQANCPKLDAAALKRIERWIKRLSP